MQVISILKVFNPNMLKSHKNKKYTEETLIFFGLYFINEIYSSEEFPLQEES